jgi:hypothetical protein
MQESVLACAKKEQACKSAVKAIPMTTWKQLMYQQPIQKSDILGREK